MILPSDSTGRMISCPQPGHFTVTLSVAGLGLLCFAMSTSEPVRHRSRRDRCGGVGGLMRSKSSVWSTDVIDTPAGTLTATVFTTLRVGVGNGSWNISSSNSGV